MEQWLPYLSAWISAHPLEAIGLGACLVIVLSFLIPWRRRRR
jgi:hypothetical protein